MQPRKKDVFDRRIKITLYRKKQVYGSGNGSFGLFIG